MAAAVNPDAFSSLAGAPKSQINIGKSIFYNEQINTTGSGLVQVLLVDGSTFTVGPGSDLVIDKFVYDPKKGVGQISASFSKGVMRFVGGKISKQEGGVNVDTPAGSLAIRGGIVYADFKSSKTYSILFVFGEYAKLAGQAALFDPGNGYFSTNGQTVIKQFTAADLKNIMASLTNSNTAGATGTPNASSKPNTLSTILATQSLNQLIADANTEMVVANAEEVTTPTTPTTEPTTPTTEPTTPQEPGEPCQVDCGTPVDTLQGYSAGIYQQSSYQPDHYYDGEYEGDNELPVGVLANWSSQDVDFKFNRNEDGSLADYFSAKFKLNVGLPGSDEGGVEIDFGNLTAPDPEVLLDRRSFISENGGLFAVNAPDGVKIFHEQGAPATPGELTPFAALISRDYVVNTNVLNSNENHTTGPRENGPPVIEPVEFCEECDFLKWGAFVTVASFMETYEGPYGPEEFEREVAALGWWVAGDIPPVSQLPLTGSATYAGDVVATVSTNLFYEGTWHTYVATGDLEMTWNFGSREGRFDVTKFDTAHFNEENFGEGVNGLSFGGSLCAPGVTCGGVKVPTGNNFGGGVAGQLPDFGPESNVDRNLEGFALGSFARGPNNFDANGAIKGSVPQGVMGNWAVGNDRYMASGIFGGSHVPTPTQ